jgi:hypothetical protein
MHSIALWIRQQFVVASIWLAFSQARLALLWRCEVGAAGDVTLKRGASAAMTITLASLATSATRVAGRESTAIPTAEPAIDYQVGGKITTGTTPTVSTQIDIWVYGSVEDTPTYPDVLDGTDSDETFSSENMRNTAMRHLHTIVVDATSDRTYWFGPLSIAAVFGGQLPKHWGLFVTHSTAVNLNSTGGNHAIYYRPVYANIAAS